jgi:hypothetical protein
MEKRKIKKRIKKRLKDKAKTGWKIETKEIFKKQS